MARRAGKPRMLTIFTIVRSFPAIFNAIMKTTYGDSTR
jgi:hypothetical protein